jgi:DNA invertase Pin-like site-specific DNA recombinase
LEQSYQRQIDELKEHCGKNGWEIKRFFTNKVSGASKIENRTEIVEMIEYVEHNHVDKVVCLSVDRLGRSVAEVSKVIAFLNEHKVSLYIKNYNMETLNPDGSINPMGTFLMNILLSVGEWEKLNIRERMSSGYQAYLRKRAQDKENHPLGRPTKYKKSDNAYREQYQKEISLLRKGISLRNVSSITGTSIGTLRKLKIYV